jgi:hypothetical protein
MIGRVALPFTAAVVALVITAGVVLGAGWFSEAFERLVAIHAVATFLRPMAFVVSPMMGMAGVVIAITAGIKHQKAVREKQMRPRIRNGRI